MDPEFKSLKQKTQLFQYFNPEIVITLSTLKIK